MANYVNLTLDTIGPAGVSVKINGDEEKTTSTAVSLAITCSDADLTGYQMKIWGTATAPEEADAAWESYQEEKNVTLSDSDGIKTIYVKVRDDVWNESVTASDTISLNSKVPAVNFRIVDSKLSLVQGKNTAGGNFGFDENIDAAKIMIVSDINARHDDDTNIRIPVTNGSIMFKDDDSLLTKEKEGYLEFENNICDKDYLNYYIIRAEDIAVVSPGDGVKILKLFVRSAETGSWSV